MSAQHGYAATTRWTGAGDRGTASYTAYSRDHEVLLDGRPSLPGSADPAFRGGRPGTAPRSCSWRACRSATCCGSSTSRPRRASSCASTSTTRPAPCAWSPAARASSRTSRCTPRGGRRRTGHGRGGDGDPPPARARPLLHRALGELPGARRAGTRPARRRLTRRAQHRAREEHRGNSGRSEHAARVRACSVRTRAAASSLGRGRPAAPCLRLLLGRPTRRRGPALRPLARLRRRGRRLGGRRRGPDRHGVVPSRISARKRPVWLASTRATCSGVPCATTLPPPEPPSGPMSTTQSALLMTSRLCSMTRTLLPLSTSDWSTPSSLRMSSKCRPVVGSSST